MRAYSVDLRERIVAAVDAGHAPRPRVGDRPEIGPERYPPLVARLQAAPDATLERHCERWAALTGQVVSVSTLWRTIARAEWTDKKRRWARPSATR